MDLTAGELLALRFIFAAADHRKYHYAHVLGLRDLGIRFREIITHLLGLQMPQK